MRARGTEFGYGVGQCAEEGDIEDGVGVFAVLDAAFGEDDGDEVDAAGREEGDRGGVCEELDGMLAFEGVIFIAIYSL